MMEAYVKLGGISMTSQAQPTEKQRSLLQNRISILGIAASLIAFHLLLFFLLIDFLREGTSLYTGLVIFSTLPVILIIGVLSVIAGVLMERRRRHSRKSDALPSFQPSTEPAGGAMRD